ncbi:hypothetical protein KR100_01545 [Synechococcus sp. KORDI-100]|nr:hypothetical protein KR100_01545 [Synechococcus sp. KORDI-100]
MSCLHRSFLQTTIGIALIFLLVIMGFLVQTISVNYLLNWLSYKNMSILAILFFLLWLQILLFQTYLYTVLLHVLQRFGPLRIGRLLLSFWKGMT